jgi:hypothetical protein
LESRNNHGSFFVIHFLHQQQQQVGNLHKSSVPKTRLPHHRVVEIFIRNTRQINNNNKGLHIPKRRKVFPP